MPFMGKKLLEEELSTILFVVASLVFLFFTSPVKEYVGVFILALGIIYKFWQREKQRRKSNIDSLVRIIQKQLNALESKFGSTTSTSIHYVNAPFEPSELWKRYHDCERKRRDDRIIKVKKTFANAIRHASINDLTWCFSEICHLTRDYRLFVMYFCETFKEKPEETKKWLKKVIDEYNTFTSNLEGDINEFDVALGAKSGLYIDRLDETLAI